MVGLWTMEAAMLIETVGRLLFRRALRRTANTVFFLCVALRRVVVSRCVVSFCRGAAGRVIDMSVCAGYPGVLPAPAVVGVIGRRPQRAHGRTPSAVGDGLDGDLP